MTDRSHLIARLREDARDLELANAEHRAPDRVLVASAVNLMMGAAEAIEATTPRTDRAPVVTFCGSSKFKDRFHELGEQAEKDGVLVLMMSFFQHTDNFSVSDEERETLDRLDYQRIDMSDSVFVINPGGYIGKSTRREIEYARRSGKTVRFLEPEQAS